jgi:DNA-binding PucR family transcriptional regulator
VVSDPDGPGQRAAIEQAIAAVGARAGLGSTVDWSQARASFVRAQAALELVERDGALIAAREYAVELLLNSDPGLADELAADRLAPFDDLSPGSRRRLRETLEVWLAEQGRLGSVAERLGIHPQTARYRVNRLRDLFGDALDDPDARFWLEVALRVGDGRPART